MSKSDFKLLIQQSGKDSRSQCLYRRSEWLISICNRELWMTYFQTKFSVGWFEQYHGREVTKSFLEHAQMLKLQVKAQIIPRDNDRFMDRENI